MSENEHPCRLLAPTAFPLSLAHCCCCGLPLLVLALILYAPILASRRRCSPLELELTTQLRLAGALSLVAPVRPRSSHLRALACHSCASFSLLLCTLARRSCAPSLISLCARAAPWDCPRLLALSAFGARSRSICWVFPTVSWVCAPSSLAGQASLVYKATLIAE